MKRQGQDVVNGVLSRGFYESASHALITEFPHAEAYIRGELGHRVNTFAETVRREVAYSDPLPGITLDDLLRNYLSIFLRQMSAELSAGGIGGDPRAAYSSVTVPAAATSWSVSDGLPTQRHGGRGESADTKLYRWRHNTSRAPVARDDQQAEIVGGYGGRPQYAHGFARDYSDVDGRTDRGCGSEAGAMYTVGGIRESFSGERAGENPSGITFCDQSEFGLDNHISQYENTAYKAALNRPAAAADGSLLMHEQTIFGVSTRAADSRLVERRTFRSEGGVENGIPLYRQRLHARHLDKDVSESLRAGGDRESHIRGYDMSGLRAKSARQQTKKASNVPYSDRLWSASESW